MAEPVPAMALLSDADGGLRVQQDGSRALLEAERFADVTPLDPSYLPGDPRRYHARGDGVTDDTAPVQAAIDVGRGYFGMVRNAEQRDIPRLILPGGAYLITGAGLQGTDGMHFSSGNDAVLLYDDTGSTGSYCLNLGTVGANGGYLTIDGLYILLRTLTANGLSIMNCIDSTYNNVRIEGFSGSYATRTNTAVKIDSDGGDCFYNDFYGLKLSHIHRGVYCPVGGIGTRQNFYGVRMSSDSGDTDGIGFEMEDCPGTTVHDAYLEGFGGACIQLTGNRSSRMRFMNTTYDMGGLGSMVGLKLITDGSGMPTGNRWDTQWWYPGTTVQDDTTAAANNFISGNPSAPGHPWTPALTPGTSGTITPNTGASGAWCIRDGHRVHVWGRILVTSVSSPVGRLFIENLPWPAADYVANYVSFPVRAADLNTSAATMLQGLVERNAARIEIEHFSAGSAASTTAADIKAGSEIIFSVHYITDAPDA